MNHKRIYRKLHLVKKTNRRSKDWYFAVVDTEAIARHEGMKLSTIRRLIQSMSGQLGK